MNRERDEYCTYRWHDGTVDLSWRFEGACLGADPAPFFPEGFKHAAMANTAKAICASCPVLDACLDHALTRPEPDGVWGGTTAMERRRIRAGRTAVAA